MEKFSKKTKISELKESQSVDDVFFVKFKKGIEQYKNGFSFSLTLSDSSGHNIEYKYWGDGDEAKIKSLYDSIKTDSIIHVQGRVGSYRNNLQLTTNFPFIIEVLQEGQYNPADFVKGPRKDANLLYAKLLSYIDLVESPEIKNLLNSVFKNKDIEAKFKTHPGAIEIHHDWVGGLLEHTIEILEYCRLSWELFPKLKKDLLIAGALLHDMGKLEELSVTTRIRGTNKGQLTSHLVLSAVFVSNKCDEAGINSDVKDKIMHMIVSHHGRLEYGSPKEPMFPEAVVLHHADEMSSKTAEMLEFIEMAKQATEDDFMYNRRGGKNVMLK